LGVVWSDDAREASGLPLLSDHSTNRLSLASAAGAGPAPAP